MQARCPSCGNMITYKSELSAYIVCSACQTLVARKGMQAEAIGKVAALQADGSIIKLGTQGTFEGKSFEVVGRIQMIWGKAKSPEAVWNEWYALFSNGSGGWLGEHLGEYLVSFVQKASGLPDVHKVHLGQVLGLGGQRAVVTSLSRGTALTYEGELPFVMDSAYEATFADLSTTSGKAATLDYSEDPPLLFEGTWCSFADLKLLGLRSDQEEESQEPAISAANLKTLKCPTCGAPHELQAGGLSKTLVCQYCDSCIDLNADNTFREVIKFEQARAKIPAKIPLGASGQLAGQDVPFTCIGFLVKSTKIEGVRYKWGEYLLYEATRGYQWLTEANGHWSILSPQHRVPLNRSLGLPVGTPPNLGEVSVDGRTFKHFQTTQSVVDYVAGEFYWRVRTGEASKVVDYVCPPEVLSADCTDQEYNWSLGRYVQGQEVWQAFKLKGEPPISVGVANNQPNPFSAAAMQRWISYLAVSLVAFVFLLFWSMKTSTPFFSQNGVYLENQVDRTVLANVTVPPGRHNVYVSVNTAGLNRRWAYVLVSLIGEKQEKIYDTAVELYHESGSDSDGPWSESVSYAGAHLAGVNGGDYLVRIEPESNVSGVSAPEKTTSAQPNPRTIFTYQVMMQNDLPQWGSFWMLVILGMLPPLYSLMRSSGFETKRWAESDHAPEGSE